eukprot:CAMPEP_0170884654 /NCGR_PEP_ID=MMETSP0734-20130129/35168_1 /TAXON_ID=186038 /ORGANISM="Fragilariopsis kerguelensis, Strain L26-C5" /LENGTH=256 /DNA_ID=CAMNT_0011269427 /DNA_START=12 /DNA_END=779 /DNA_ORIENTATION=-
MARIYHLIPTNRMLVLLLLLGVTSIVTVTKSFVIIPDRNHNNNYLHMQKKQPQDPFDVPRPDPSILISAKPPDEQKLWITGLSASLVVGTSLLVTILSTIEQKVLPDNSWFGTLGNVGTIPLGVIFAAIGAAHFAKPETFTSIVPPKGTWGGLWQVPAPGADKFGVTYEEYHTYWSGLAELLGGLLLAASGFGLVPVTIQQFDAFLMLILTLAVTPANIYMATHDAQMEGGPPPMAYPDAHIFRGVIQIILLADFW